jgi:hypothetical protein
MKTIDEIKTIFKVFDVDKNNSHILEADVNYKIIIFKPFERNNETIFSFRVYGKVEGSKIQSYNSQLQWFGGVDYLYNNEEKKMVRKDYVHDLHKIIKRITNTESLLRKL